MAQRISHIFLILLLLFCLSLISGASVSGEHFYIREEKGLSRAILEDIIEAIELARQEITDQVKRPLSQKIEIVLCKTPDEFNQLTNFSSEHILACAVPEKRIIYVNLSLLSRQELEQFHRTMVHEYAHIYLGIMCDRRLPRWLDEGIAMHLSGEWSLNDSINLAFARFFGSHIELSELESTFPGDPRRMRLAYLQSYSLVSLILKERYRNADISVFVNDLTAPSSGLELINLYWNPLVRDGYERYWFNASKYSFRNMLVVLAVAFNTIFWFGVGVLFIVAYIRKRRSVRPLLDEWEFEEHLLSSLNSSDYESDEE